MLLSSTVAVSPSTNRQHRRKTSSTPKAPETRGKPPLAAQKHQTRRRQKPDNRQHNLRIKVARIFNTYGPRMHPNDGRVVSNFIMQALRNQPITLYGDGLQTRSFCYVDDLTDGLIRLMETGDDVTGPINLGNPDEFTIRELAEKVVALIGSKSKISYHPLPSDDPRQRKPDIALATGSLQWQPKVALAEGLSEAIRYFQTSI